MLKGQTKVVKYKYIFFKELQNCKELLGPQFKTQERIYQGGNGKRDNKLEETQYSKL